MPADSKGLLDTNVLVHRQRVAEDMLPDLVAISAVTLAELSAGPHHVVGTDPGSSRERAARIAFLQRTENEFDPIPFDVAAARVFGQMVGAVIAAGRRPRLRLADLMIAATASAHSLPLYTMDPDDFHGLEPWLEVVTVPRPGSAGAQVPTSTAG